MLTSWIIYNGTLPGTKFERQANLITQAAEPLGIQTSSFRNDDVRFLLPLDESFDALPDAVFFFDKDAALAERFEASGCLTMNRSDVIRLCDDKVAQTLAFQRANLPMPETIIAPKSFPKSVTLSDEALRVVTERLGLPLIVKEAHGSFGMTVYFIETFEALRRKVDALVGRDFLFQRYVKESHGRDVRVNVVGGHVVAAMKRTSDCDFRANVTNGGRAEVVVLTEEERSLAIRAADAVGATFAGVDLLYGASGPLVCEVNAAAHIENIYKTTGINVARPMLDYVREVLR